jgi:hypothetical protein
MRARLTALAAARTFPCGARPDKPGRLPTP